jgi:hypothetical protein
MGQLFSDIGHKVASGISLRKQSVTLRQTCCWLTATFAGIVLALTLVSNPHQGLQTAGITPASYGRSVPISLIGSTLPDPTSKAITYNTALVPVDAGILASIEPAGGWVRSQTVATLTVTGLLRVACLTLVRQ